MPACRHRDGPRRRPSSVELWSDRDALGACSFELGDLEHDLVDERVMVVVDLGPVRGVALDDHHLVARDDVVARVDKPDLVRRRHVRGEQSVVEPLARQLVHEVPLGRLRRRGRRSPVVRAVVLRTGGDATPAALAAPASEIEPSSTVRAANVRSDVDMWTSHDQASHDGSRQLPP